MARSVALDNDFLSHLSETRGEELDVYTMIQYFFEGMDVLPELHELVYKYETRPDDPLVKRLLKNKDILIRNLTDIWNGHPGGQRYYEMVIRQVYRDMTGEDYPCAVCTKWRRQKSLGEVHSVIMCMFLCYDCFLSDDRGAANLRKIVENKFSRTVNIYSREQCRTKIQESEEKCRLSSNQLSRLAHAARG